MKDSSQTSHISTRQEKDTSIMCAYAPLDNISAH